MGKSDLIESIQTRMGKGTTKEQAATSFDAVVGALATTIAQEGELAVRDFGTFRVRERKARVGRNPKTGEPLDIPKSKGVGFKPAKALKESL